MPSSSLAINARRARAGLAVFAIGALGVGFTACGDDSEDEATDSVLSELEEAGVNTDEVEEQANSIQSELEEQGIDTEELEQQAEDAQKQLEELQNQLPDQ